MDERPKLRRKRGCLVGFGLVIVIFMLCMLCTGLFISVALGLIFLPGSEMTFGNNSGMRVQIAQSPRIIGSFGTGKVHSTESGSSDQSGSIMTECDGQFFNTGKLFIRLENCTTFTDTIQLKSPTP